MGLKSNVWRGVSASAGLLLGLVFLLGNLAIDRQTDVNLFLGTTAPKTSGTGDALYFKSSYASAQEVVAAEKDHNIRMQEEASVLLKNKANALPLKSSERRVSLFGRAVADPVYRGQSGGAAFSGTSFHAFKTSYVVITGMFRYDYSSYDAVLDLTRRLNAAGERLKKEGLALLYHNHNCEFRPCGEEKAFDVILRKSQSEFVNFEFDSYWCAECGASPLEWMAKLGPRFKLYHINDRGCKALGALPSIVKSDSAELGLGNLPLADYIKEAESLSVEAIIIESHQNWLENSGLASLRYSVGYLRKHL